MAKKNLLILILLFLGITGSGQIRGDSLWMEGSKIMWQGYEIYPAAARDMMYGTPEAFEFMKEARNKKAVANVFGFAGGFLIGFPIGQLIGGNDNPNWLLAAAGGGLIIGAMANYAGYKEQARQAISVYNS